MEPRWYMLIGARTLALVLALALQVAGLVTSPPTACPPEKCPDGKHCWSQPRNEVRIGWGYRNFGVCLSEENCGLATEPDGVDFTYQMNPVIVQDDETVVFHSIEEDLFLNPHAVSKQTFENCKPLYGLPLVDNPTREDIPVTLNLGANYFIHKGRNNSVYACDFGLKVKIIRKSHNCGELGPDGLCSGHGYCVSDPEETYSDCTCCEGYEGQHCDHSYRTCANFVCQNGGSCQSHDGSVRCLCPPGYTGEACERLLPTENSVKTTVPTTAKMNSGLPKEIKDSLHWIQIQLYLPDLNCLWWETNDTLHDAVMEEIYGSVRDNLLPSALGHCFSRGAHYGFGDDESTLDCYGEGDGALFKVGIASPKSSSKTTAELLCIMSYYLRNNTITFDVFEMSFIVASDFPLSVLSTSALDCDDIEVFTRLCVVNETSGKEKTSLDGNVGVTTNSSYIPKEGAVSSKYNRMPLLYLILCIMIPICLLLMIIMAVGLIVYKKKYTKSYTFKDNIKMAKLGKLEGRPRSMDVETELSRKKYLYGGPPSPVRDDEFERQRNASGSSTIPVPDNEVEFRPARTRVDSGTSTIRSKGSDVRRISDDCVRIITVKPTEGANGEAHGFENKAFQYMDDNQSADSAIEDSQSV